MDKLFMEFKEVLCARASVREYADEKISREVLERLVDAGRRAPSARAVEPWEFVAVTDKEILRQLAGLAANGAFVAAAAAAIVVFCRETKYYLEDGCAATENILLAATSAGLGACWIAGDKKEYAQKVTALLGAPAGMKLISIISVGVPVQNIKQVKRRSLEQVFHWEIF
ncbi:MAG: nitroreductase family protein [Candidatus Omnitrophica bacterium]|nr:nitroreductase family protein [Candidatus Omnitrophota bacterium]MBU4479325.1 nitroreductase family protein [Candidatus Omnitrophota bacterium]MCG2704235.1 nitroreductase family protein [Candidatus Omnitrophota bacterium]